jgi:hypothetical protein
MFAEDFGVEFFEGKQTVLGQDSTTKWETDAKGVNSGTNSFLVVECRRFTGGQRQSQGKLASLAYVISDVRACDGIMVSPYDLQHGAELVARANNIETVILNADSTIESFRMHFVDKLKVCAGVPLFTSGK